jgi:CDP-6-deoxy-D-xylo-4-hexulose-3-dehydrase
MEGGIVVTNDGRAARLYRLWRNHGWEPKAREHFYFPTWGMNLRPTELQGAFGGVQLDKMQDFREAREENYTALLLDAIDPHSEWLQTAEVLPRCAPAWHGFPILVNADAPFDKADLCAFMEARGIETRPLIAGNLARQPAVLADNRVICGALPGADFVHNHAFYIGLASFDDHEGTQYVADTIDAFMRHHK